MSTVNASLNMILGQLYTNNLNEVNFLEAFLRTPREQLLPNRYKNIAYIDHDIEVKPGIFQMSPMNLAKILLAAKIKPTENVLEIGAGSGVNALILARLVNRVDSLSSDLSLIKSAVSLCEKNNIKNCRFMDHLTKDYNYDLIIVNGYSELPLGKLLEYLAKNGRMIIFEPLNENLLAPLCNMSIVTKANNISKNFVERINMFKLEPIKI